MFKSNLVKVSLGLAVGFPLFYMIRGLEWYYIVLIQWIFFTCFYSVVDKVVLRDG